MKAACLTLAMIGFTVLIDGTSYAFSFSSASQEQSTVSSSKPLSTDHATNAAPPHDPTVQKGGTPSDERTRRRSPNKNHPHSQAKPVKANRPKQLRNGRERSTAENVMSVAQPNSSTTAAGAVRVANNRTLARRPTGVAALSGQQFKNRRNRGAAPATVGGPPSSTRNTATISGTSINRKRSN